MANPDAENEAEYSVETVEDALMRHGIGCALVLAMGTPLALALIKTFQTMLALKLESIDRNQAAPPDGKHLLGTIDFSGKVVGQVYLRMNLDSAPGRGRRHSRPEAGGAGRHRTKSATSPANCSTS